MQQRNIKIIKKKKLKIERVKKLKNACYNKLLIQQQNMRNKTLTKLFTKSRDSYHGNSVVMVTDPGLALIFCIKCFMTCAQQDVVYMSMYKWILAVEQCKINAENFHRPGKCLNTKTRSPKGSQPKLKPKPISEVTK